MLPLFEEEYLTIKNVQSIFCDLASPKSIVAAVDELGSRKFDIVICNSGIVLDSYQTAEIGIEKTFAVNVFGHHLLYRLLITREMLNAQARIVITSGEAYVNHNKHTPNQNNYKGSEVYGGTKLGNLWQVLELTKRYASIKSFAVHPGVIASGFVGGSKSGFAHWLRSKILISEEQGAQASLIAATQDLPRGSYWHNLLGIVDLPACDVARDQAKSKEQWKKLEELAKPWL